VKITAVEAVPLAVSFKEAFRFGTTDRTTSPNVVAVVRTDEDAVGYGEACPVPAFTSETQSSIVELVERRVAPVLTGGDPLNRTPLLHALARVLRFAPFTVAAVDTALLDLAGRALGVPAHALLGGAFRDRVEVHGSVGWQEDAADMVRTAVGQAATYRSLKLYAGRGDVHTDLDRLCAVRTAVGPDAGLFVDANDAARVAATRCASVVNVGHSKLGGPTAAFHAAQVAAAHGLGVMVGSVIEMGIATAMGLHLAAALPRLAYPSYLMGLLKYREQLVAEQVEVAAGHVAVPAGPGLGVNVDEQHLRALDARRRP
jgi:muconate cycloisomerase